MEDCDDGCQDTGPTHSHATPDSTFLLGEGAHSASPHLSPIYLRVNSVSALYTSACSLASSRFSHRSQRPIAQSIPANSTLDFFNSQLETYAAKTASRLHLQRKEADADGSLSDDIRSGVYEVDTCYSWIVLLACSVVVLISQIHITISGILYLEFIESFPNHKNLILWGCSLAASLTYLLGPLAALFVEKTSARTSAMVGCAGMGLSLFVMSLTTNIVLFFILYGILSSTFGSLAYIPAVTFLVYHFDKYKQTALILASISAAAAYLILPPIIAEILKLYTWREATLFTAVLCMQGTALSALMRLPALICPSLPLNQHHYISAGSPSISSSHIVTRHIDGATSNEHTSSTLVAHSNHQDSLSTENCTDSTVLKDSKLSCEKLDDEEEAKSSMRSRLWEAWSPLFHWRMGALMAISVVYGWNSGIYFVRVPSHVEKLGLTPKETVELYMYGAITSIGVRFILALIGRLIDYDKAAVTCAAGMIGSACMIGFTLSTDYPSFSVCCTLYGTSHAILASLATPAILEVHGDHRVEFVFGLEMMFLGVSLLVSPPIAGFALSAGISMAGAVTFLPHLIIKYSKRETATEILDSKT